MGLKKTTYLFILLISFTFLLKGMGVFTEEFVGVVWPVLLGVAVLLQMGKN
jgi:hypothetical protein